MDCQKIGSLIKKFRLELGLSRKQLADKMGLSDKTVSKWERGMGCPDISLLEELSAILKIDVKALLAGEICENKKEGDNMKNTACFICPVCGNISFCTGNASVSCCGRPLLALEASKATAGEQLKLPPVEDEWHIESTHPMKKNNYISFTALATGDKIHIYKQYPEWELHVRLPRKEHGKLLWYSTTKGLYYQLI